MASCNRVLRSVNHFILENVIVDKYIPLNLQFATKGSRLQVYLHRTLLKAFK